MFLPYDSRIEYSRLESAKFRRSLLQRYLGAAGSVPRPVVVANVLATLLGREEIQSDVEAVSLRVARDGTKAAILVDLGDVERRAVRVCSVKLASS